MLKLKKGKVTSGEPLRGADGRFISQKSLNQTLDPIEGKMESKLTSVEYLPNKQQPHIYERTEVWSDEVKDVLFLSLAFFILAIIF
ncbi:hypothetical protein MM221_17060 [Salipaludibacillus sp. LMS25]|uniref:hypothetical protein n=1 Tax=Salipaludibacillus sp. LMS25 TaxID=2924031 RepID=UPI0020D03252|nr:hypothetical protein [Salipaludibacillus sp. LMS25]UTR14255.1 hypothetical protein MM221_17060 [Salipaludibacillus sp. LMS25]